MGVVEQEGAVEQVPEATRTLVGYSLQKFNHRKEDDRSALILKQNYNNSLQNMKQKTNDDTLQI